VLVFGLVPTVLAAGGFVSALRRPAALPVTLTAVTSLGVYIYWFTTQEHWALKTKYLLFLLPVYALYALFGLEWIKNRSVLGYRGAVWLLVALSVLCHAYLFTFALGE
jgi:hypothetical protein